MRISGLLLVGMLLSVFAEPGMAARQRITLMPETGEYSEADIEKEIIFGREMAAIILAERRISPDSRLNRYLNLVGQSVARQTNRPELNFFFGAVESNSINAYAAPGGYIFITTAALDLMQNEAELAGVLAHEIAHVTDRHIVRELNIREDDESMVAEISKIVTLSTESAAVVLGQALSHALDILFSSGLQVEDEYDADLQGMYLASLAGYDATAYRDYLARIKPVIEAGRGELTGTHPPFAERLKRLETIIEQEGMSEMGAYKNEKRFREHVPRDI